MYITIFSVTRAEASLDKLQELNTSCTVQIIDRLDVDKILEEKYNGVIITEAYGIDWAKDGNAPNKNEINIYQLNYTLRENKIGLILTECLSMYGYIFTDFGTDYQIINTGVEESQLRIKDITFEKEAVVIMKYCPEGTFREGDTVEFLNLEGSKGLHMLNEKEFKVLEVIGSGKNNRIRIN